MGIASTIVRCARCSLLFPDPFPVPCDPHALYGDPVSYFSRHPEADRIVEYRRLIREVAARSGLDNPSLLDVGSGRGDLVQAAGLEGLTDVVGLEFAPAMVEHARAHHGIELHRTTLEEYIAENPRIFDAVVLNAVIEHVYDPDSLIRNVTAALRPGGILYIDTPRDPNLLTWIGNARNRMLGRKAIYNLSPTWPPFHVFGFTPRSLGILLTKHGFTVEAVRVHNNPLVPSRAGLVDKVNSFVGTQILRLGNVTATGSNMYVWARRSGTVTEPTTRQPCSS
jgi:SAM-dependent methyltransferase